MTANELKKIRDDQEKIIKTQNEDGNEPNDEGNTVDSYKPDFVAKTERLQLMVKPETYKSLRKVAKMTDESVNSIIGKMVENFLNEEQTKAIVAHYDEVFGTDVIKAKTRRKL